jgi:hypothetical protein
VFCFCLLSMLFKALYTSNPVARRRNNVICRHLADAVCKTTGKK